MIADTPEKIVQAVKQAGIIGAGGGGFPTYVKLQAQVSTVIANGSECEPLLSSDRTMMIKNPEGLIEGLRGAMKATGASHGVIALKHHYEDAIAALKPFLPSDGSIRLHLLENYYPAGDEFLLVYEVTGKVIPEGGIPLNVGVVVNNVITLMQVSQALNGKPVTERAVTLVGEFNKPKVVVVPIGTTYENLIQLGGGLKLPNAVLIDGGPMMGKIIQDISLGIGKTTSGIIALPADHFVIRMMQKPLGQVIKQSKAACCQCFRCTDLCPRNLLGHDIYPHMTMRTIDYNLLDSSPHVTSAFLCSQCGMCELISCDIMQLSPRKIFAAYKKELIRRGVKNPHKQVPAMVCSSFDDRKMGIATVLKKIDLTRYDVTLPFVGQSSVMQVRIPSNKHIGAKSEPCVSIGQKVRMCDMIAASKEGQLGSISHASISGKVTAIADDFIEITGQR